MTMSICGGLAKAILFSLLLALFFIGTKAANGDCEPSFHGGMRCDYSSFDNLHNSNLEFDWKQHNSHLYKVFVDEPVNAFMASRMCRRLGAQLASVHSLEENNFLLALMDKADPGRNWRFWIGLTIVKRWPKRGVINHGSSGGHRHISVVSKWTDGTPVDFGDPRVLKPGTMPWTRNGNDQPEPNNSNRDSAEDCVIFGHGFPGNGSNFVGWVDSACQLESELLGNGGFGADIRLENHNFGYICKKMKKNTTYRMRPTY